MPQVASELKSHALSHSLSLAARPPQAAEREQAASFESLLDDAPPPAREPRAQPASSEPAPRTDRPQKNAVKSADKPEKPAKSEQSAEPADGGEPDKTEAPANEVAAAAEGQPVVVAGAVEPAQAGDIVKTEGDDTKQTSDTKAADTAKAEAAAIVPVPAQAPAPTGINAIAVAIEGVAVPAATTEAAETPVPQAGKIEIAATAMQKAQPEALAASQIKLEKKSDGEKPAADAKVSSKVSPEATAAVSLKVSAAPELKTPAEALAEALPKAPAEALPNASPKASPEVSLKASSEAPAKVPAPQFAPDTGAQPATAEAGKDAAARPEAAANSHGKPGVEIAGTASADSHAATPKIATDLTQPIVLTASTQAAQTPAQAATPAAAAQPAPQAAAIPISGVAIEIASKAQAGTNHFEIRLDPPELGRIHVRLEVDRDGNVISHMVADRTDTLDLLRRDSAGLERALQDAGLKTANNSLQFSLRDQTANQQQNGDGRANTAQLVVEDETLPAIDATQYARLGGRAGGLDISV